MSARITIQSGIAAGTSHRIVNRVARVGSDPQSEVCLPTADIPSHALTLEFRDDGCRVYNRCKSNVQIGAQLIEPDQVAAWPETDILQLGQDTELLLDFLDPQYTENDEAFDFDEDEEDLSNHDLNSEGDNSTERQEDQKKASSLNAKIIMQMVVTTTCLVGCVFLLLREQNRKSGPDTGPGFSEIVSTAIANPTVVSPELVQRLQHAEAQRIRGRKEIAHDEYQSIRDDLIRGSNEIGNESENPNTQILSFIQGRLE